MLSLFLHLWRLNAIPSGFFLDESSIGYNAFSILETGKDEHGTAYPLLFKCFGNYQDPVMVYTIVPLIKLFGLTTYAVRMPSAFYMILASVLFYFLSFQYCRNYWLSLISAAVFSILPWAFPISRSTMSGYTPMLLGITIGCLFLFKSFAHNSWKYAVVAASGWSLAMYSHNCGRPMSAVLIVSFFLALNVGIWKRLKSFIVFAFSLLFFMIPMIIYVLNHPEGLTNRFNKISVWNDSPEYLIVFRRIISRYVEYFSPGFLFFAGDTNLRHCTGTTGELYIFMLPLIAIGLFVMLRYAKHNLYYRFALIGLLTYPFAAILTIDHFHSTRTVNGLPFWMLTAVIGAKFLISQNRKYKKIKWKRVLYPSIFIFIGVMILWETGSYFEDYFNPHKYATRSRLHFLTPEVEAVRIGFENLAPGETLYLSRSFICDFYPNESPLYITLLFFGKINPDIYQKQGIPKKLVADYIGHVSSPGVLLRSTHYYYTIDKRGNRLLCKNIEYIPKSHKLISSLPITKRIHYQVYKIAPDL